MKHRIDRTVAEFADVVVLFIEFPLFVVVGEAVVGAETDQCGLMLPLEAQFEVW